MSKTKTQRNRRRYYLHQRIKRFTDYNARAREVKVNDRILEERTDKERQYLRELIDFGYNLQSFIE
ncbi:MAG: hypothetical protein K9I74_14620 [Bacteroidales bacterium]|nr:hypothetical protein [Bacteroidales bacterium]